MISAPGYYRIPLVYGNAITNKAKIESAYKTSNTGTYILSHFKDHNDQPITDPWITQTNGGTNKPDGAKLVWADETGLVETTSLGISADGKFLQFRVPQDKIKTGNAVIAATKGGVVVWSWHLWFTEANVLNTTKVTNFENVDYNFTNETLGWKYTAWNGTTYSAPRSVRVKVEQIIANSGVKKFATITITQNNANALCQGYSTFYQFGRKDAFPGTDTTPDGSITKNSDDIMSIQNGIQHPETFYANNIIGPMWYSNYNQYNFWSMDNTTTGFNDNAVVKTIYDPCPAGFKMPASKAFTGFNTNGQMYGTKNVSGAWENGWNFYNRVVSPDATVYFPASGMRNTGMGGVPYVVDHAGFYWSAIPSNTGNGCCVILTSTSVHPLAGSDRAHGHSVRPVAD